MLTPAISVISAVEGLHVVSPQFSHYVLPITLAILLLLFASQRFGTAKIGSLFGPIILIWFVIIGTLGAIRIVQNPTILSAINPYYAFEFFRQNGWVGYALLGGIFLVITGAEALYADLGHFGKTPIRIGWYTIALPGLLLNYFGQGAYLLHTPTAIANPFYALAPVWFSFPLLIFATIATIIASQAVISASFSLAKQAILLEVCPRLAIIQTSSKERGQVYVPQINFILAIGTLLLVMFFKSSTAIAGAYGLAVNLVMIIVATLVIYVAYQYWRWSIAKIIQVFSVFALIDLAFLGANLHKVIEGGWIPLVFAGICAVIMITWRNGMRYLRTSYYMDKGAVADIIGQLNHTELNYLPHATAIFIADPYDKSGGGLLHYLKLNRIMPEHVLIVSIAGETRPHIHGTQRFELNLLVKDIYHLILHVGFMQTPNIPKALAAANHINIFPFNLDIDKANFLIEIPNITATKRKKTLAFFWQERLFAFLMRNAVLDIEFFQLPYNRTIGIGTYCEI